MNIKAILISLTVMLLSSGCGIVTTMTPAERAKRDYENAVALEARSGYRWTQMWSDEYRKLSLKEYDIDVAVWDLRHKAEKAPLTAEEQATYDELLKKDAKIKARKVVLREKLAPSLALQSASTYAQYRRDYAMQDSLHEKERLANKSHYSAGAMFPGPGVDGNR